MAPTESSSVTISRREPVAFDGPDGVRTVVWLRGEHDVATVADLSDTMARAISFDDADLMVDLSGVEFMGAATVGVLVRTRTFLRLRSRALVVRAPSRCARRVLDLCGVADLLELGPVDAVQLSASTGALGTWVAVPATERVDRRADVPPAPARHPETDRTRNVALSEGP